MTISLIFHNTAGTVADFVGAGVWTITNAAQGQANYAWAASDTALAGTFQLFVVLTDSNGNQDKSDPIPFTILPA